MKKMNLLEALQWELDHVILEAPIWSNLIYNDLEAFDIEPSKSTVPVDELVIFNQFAMLQDLYVKGLQDLINTLEAKKE